MREVASEAYAHQDLPFERLVEELNPSGPEPLAALPGDVVLQNAAAAGPRFAGVSVSGAAARGTTSKFDLTAFFADTGENRGSFQYNTDLFDASTVRRMLSHLEVLLAGIVANPDRVSRLPLLPERSGIRCWWNGTRREAEYPGTRRCTAVRGAGGAGAGGRGGGVGGQAADVRAVERAGQPAGELFGQAGCGTGGSGGAVCGAVPGDGGGASGDPKGGRGVRAAGPGVPWRAAALHARRCGGAARC